MPIPSIQFQSTDVLKRYLAGCAIAFALFGLALLGVLTLPALSRWDLALSSLVQELRSPALDLLMLIMTMLGDLRLAVALFAVVIASLVFLRRWWLSLHLLSVGLSAMLSVSIIKSVVARARPDVPSIVLDSFSFPSGHACTAAVAWGLTALMLAYGRQPAQRRAIHAAGFAVVVAVAFSRVYLQVHWPSDVIAGVALGYGLLGAFAWQLQTAPSLTFPAHGVQAHGTQAHGTQAQGAQRTPALGKLLLLVGLLAAVYVSMAYEGQARRYSLAFGSASCLVTAAQAG